MFLSSDFFVSLMQDKNRDVIVAFPDADPSSISFSQLRYHHYGKPLLRRAVLNEETGLTDYPHMWYSTSEVVRALELFLAGGNQLQSSNTYRFHASIYVKSNVL